MLLTGHATHHLICHHHHHHQYPRGLMLVDDTTLRWSTGGRGGSSGGGSSGRSISTGVLTALMVLAHPGRLVFTDIICFTVSV